MAHITERDVLNAIQDALSPGGKNVTKSSTVKNLEEWDSLGHLGVLAALDTLFDGKIANIKEMATVDSVERILQLLREHSLL